MSRPVLLGGRPGFSSPIPLVKPVVPDCEQVHEEFRMILGSGMLTNANWVRAFEKATASYLGVKHVVAVSSCSIGLVLVLKALGISGKVIMPSFTFCATGHAAVWNGLEPVFCECDPRTLNADPSHVESLMTDDVAAIMGVHVFGAPCDLGTLGELARRCRVPLVIDAAHALGSRWNGEMVGGQAVAHVFSLSPTKVLVAGEGGIIATNDAELANDLIVARNYGHDGDYDCVVAGINARMTEINALIGVTNLRRLETMVAKRLQLVDRYKELLSGVEGIEFQVVVNGDRSTYKDLTIIVDEDRFGMTRDELALVLESEWVATKKYFYPPLHEQKVYSDQHRCHGVALPITERVSRQTLTLPLYYQMDDGTVAAICDRIRMAQEFRCELRQVLAEKRFEGRNHLAVPASMSAL